MSKLNSKPPTGNTESLLSPSSGCRTYTVPNVIEEILLGHDPNGKVGLEDRVTTGLLTFIADYQLYQTQDQCERLNKLSDEIVAKLDGVDNV